MRGVGQSERCVVPETYRSIQRRTGRSRCRRPPHPETSSRKEEGSQARSAPPGPRWRPAPSPGRHIAACGRCPASGSARRPAPPARRTRLCRSVQTIWSASPADHDRRHAGCPCSARLCSATASIHDGQVLHVGLEGCRAGSQRDEGLLDDAPGGRLRRRTSFASSMAGASEATGTSRGCGTSASPTGNRSGGGTRRSCRPGQG